MAYIAAGNRHWGYLQQDQEFTAQTDAELAKKKLYTYELQPEEPDRAFCLEDFVDDTFKAWR